MIIQPLKEKINNSSALWQKDPRQINDNGRKLKFTCLDNNGSTHENKYLLWWYETLHFFCHSAFFTFNLCENLEQLYASMMTRQNIDSLGLISTWSS